MCKKPKIHQVLVVEGKDDTQRLRQYYQVDTIETNGSALSPETLEAIRQAQALRGVIVFTDPDISGQLIRQTIVEAVPGVQQAFLDREAAKPKHKGSLGVEHANFQAIDEALQAVYEVVEEDSAKEKIRPSQLMALGLIGQPSSSQRREYLSQSLKLGHVSGKQLGKRLNAFGIPYDKVCQVMQAYERSSHA